MEENDVYDDNISPKRIKKKVSDPKQDESTPDGQLKLPFFWEYMSIATAESQKEQNLEGPKWAENAIGKILDTINQEALEDQRMKALEAELIELNKLEPIVKNNEIAAIDSSPPLPVDRTSGKHPGHHIFEKELFLRYFSNVNVLLYAHKSLLEKLNAKRTTKYFNVENFMLLVNKLFFKKSNKFNEEQELFELLFKIMVINDQNECSSQKCLENLEHILDIGKTCFPPVNTVIDLLSNLGVRANNNCCPLVDEFQSSWASLDLMQLDPSDRRIGRSRTRSKTSQNQDISGVAFSAEKVIMMIEVISSCIGHYKEKELCQLILAFYWISLDSNLVDHPLIKKVTMFCEASLNHIEEPVWNEKVLPKLSTQLVSVGQHHHNILYLVNHLPTTERGLQLKASTSYRAMHVLLQLETTNSPTTSTMHKALLRFLLQTPLESMKEYYLLYSIISFVDCCIKEEIIESDQIASQILKDIANELMRIYSRIKDNMYYRESSRVKDLIIMIRCKFVMFARGMDPYANGFHYKLEVENETEQHELWKTPKKKYKRKITN